MATYKVIQDIEAEDKLLGPLTLRQFIYAAIVVVSGFIGYKLIAVGWWLALPLLPHMILFGFLAAPLGKEQPSEIWLLAKIRFFLKPRRRIWDQSGVKELVTVTAPKRIERVLTDNLSQAEVRSRLQALANTIDSRGWSVKNADVNMFTSPVYAAASAPIDSDRLVAPASLPREVPAYEVTAYDDMLDESTNPRAAQLNQLIDASTTAHRQQIMARMQGQEAPQMISLPQPTTGNGTGPQQAQPDYWFMHEQPQATPPGYAVFGNDPVVAPGASVTSTFPQPQPTVSSEDEAALLARIHEEQSRPNPMHSKLKTILPLEERQELERQEAIRQARERAAAEADKAAMTAQPDPAILELANNDDLNVATLARQAQKRKGVTFEDGEVVISLH